MKQYIVTITLILHFLPLQLSAQHACTGSATCHVCTNCKYCKYCNSGGTCGVCQSNQNSTQVPVKAAAHKPIMHKDCMVFNRIIPDEDNANSYDVVVSNLKKVAFTSEMWPLVNKIVSLNKIDTNCQRTVRIFLYVKQSDGYYCYYQKIPNGESTIEY